jgi:Flp pilus assembly protein TadD
MWSPRSTDWKLATGLPAALGALLLIAACSSGPKHVTVPERQAQAAGSTAPGSGSTGSTPQGAAAPAAAGQGTATPPEPPPAQAVAEFDLAVSAMRKGSTLDAEQRFEVLATEYPQFAGAEINLGILYRKAGQLELSEQALREAVQRSAMSAVAWNELGVTLRLRGQFRDAGDAYRKAIAADANFAPAYRNLGVLLDLYLGDAPGALAALERYKELSGEQKPVTGWIAELRHRVGKSAAPSAGASPPRAAHPTPARDLTPSEAPVEEPATARTGAGG